MSNEATNDKAMTETAPPSCAPSNGSVCAFCGSFKVRKYRCEYGKSGEWNYSWEEGVKCLDCKRIRISCGPDTQNAPGERPATDTE